MYFCPSFTVHCVLCFYCDFTSCHLACMTLYLSSRAVVDQHTPPQVHARLHGLETPPRVRWPSFQSASRCSPCSLVDPVWLLLNKHMLLLLHYTPDTHSRNAPKKLVQVHPSSCTNFCGVELLRFIRHKKRVHIQEQVGMYYRITDRELADAAAYAPRKCFVCTRQMAALSLFSVK